MKAPALALSLSLPLAAALSACGDDEAACDDTVELCGAAAADCSVIVGPSDDDQTAVQEALITAQPGDTVCFHPGQYTFTAELSLDVDNVTVRGAGMEATVFDFSGQEVGAGANGIKASSDGVTFEDLQVRDTPGDGIRVDDANGVTFRRVWVAWTAEESEDNGAYGMYPIGCTDVLIEDSKVNGARDAGIYVGQSNDILVQRNEAWGNVAGIEIENSNNAEVRDNHAHDNSAGILVFNLPGLAQYGSRTNVHSNLIESNNVPNFGVQGTVVANVPGGTGIIVLACDENEFHNNEIRDNRTAAAILFTYHAGLFGSYDDDDFDIHPVGNWFHDNTYSNNGTSPIGTLHNVLPEGLTGEPSPDILWDGCSAAAAGDTDPLCVQENGATYMNLDFCNSFENPVTDLATVDCAGVTLPSMGE